MELESLMHVSSVKRIKLLVAAAVMRGLKNSLCGAGHRNQFALQQVFKLTVAKQATIQCTCKTMGENQVCFK
jgi:hypothetical protein